MLLKAVLFSLCVALIAPVTTGPLHAAEKPNIVFIITDDQGYGDLGYTGNPIIKTPNIDRLASESSQLTDYHVAPTCSPTRAALLTGHWTDRTGVWHTVNGRSMLRENEITIAQLLKDHGYATGMFGKWHLGDNFPYRAEDRGFTHVYRHGGGGVGQTPDVWDNAYFDGSYFFNGEIVPAKGFCTDVFFDQANQFIRSKAEKREPFFAYISLNAPHGPLHAPQQYMDMYADQAPAIAAFFGMITNIDDNVGKTRQLLQDLGIAENTLVIFTTDNGTATGAKIFNAGMRGAKGSEYDGGHRVPLIAHWPAKGWNKQHQSNILCHAVDIVPTLLELVGAPSPSEIKFDGQSIRPLLDPTAKTDSWPDRFLVTDSQRVRDPIKWKQTAVMSQRWRLINGKELYDMQEDPGQQQNVASQHPLQFKKMVEFYDRWWAELEPTFAQTTEIYLGHLDHPTVTLTGHDWIQSDLPPWNQQHIRGAEGFQSRTKSPQASKNPKQKSAAESVGKMKVHDGHWAVKVVNPGEYRIGVRRWPVEADHPINAGLPAGENVPGASRAFRTTKGVALPVKNAVLRINGTDLESRPVGDDDVEVSFNVKLEAGSHQLAPIFTTSDGNQIGAYYAVITFLQ
jgi:arylsulfatase B